jgi:type IV pilus assembly protein PilO
MTDIIDSLLQRPKAHLIFFWLGSLGLVVFFVYYFSLSYSFAHIGETQKKVNLMRSEIVGLRSKFKELKQLKDVKVKLEERIASAEKELPEEEEMPRLLSTLSGLAKASGLDIQLWHKENELFKDFYVELPVSVEVVGTFHQVATFFDEVGRLDRIVNITNISMVDPTLAVAGSVRVKTSCIVTTFRQLTEAEKKQREEAAKAAQKQGRR